MLEEIRKKYGVEASGAYTNLPLEFERIYLEALSSNKAKGTYALKQDIVGYIPDVTNLSLHRRFMLLPIDDIITTNYDYFVEQSLDPAFKRDRVTSHTNERKYSLFRYISVDQKKVWHMHGEAHCPDSICLGYDQYCTYLARMIQCLTQPPTGISRKPMLRYYIEGGRIPCETWATKFFTHDIFIFGLTMSLLEIDLWWLLTYRRRFILENPQYKISNQIHYFYAVSGNKIDDEQISLLDSAGVKLHPIPLVRNDWKKLYAAIFSKVESIINSR